MSGNDDQSLADDGRVVWLEKGEVNGKKIDVILRCGHRLKTDGLPDIRRVSATIFAPDGSRSVPAMLPADDGILLRFHTGGTGFYTVIASLEPAGALPGSPGTAGHRGDGIRRTARAIVEVGKRVVYAGKPAGEGLEIVPREAYLEIGRTIDIAVFHDGKSAGRALLVAYSEKAGREQHYPTGGNGRARVPVDEGGRWLFTARHAEHPPGAADGQAMKRHETTLVMDTIARQL